MVTTRVLRSTACSSGGRTHPTQGFCSCFRPFISNADDLTSEFPLLPFNHPTNQHILTWTILPLQISPLQQPGHQTEPSASRSLLQPWKCVQGERPAAGGARSLQTSCPVEAGLHRRLHKPGRGPCGSRRHGGCRPSLRVCPSVQSGTTIITYFYFTMVTI